jgi:hypothetical protein
MMLNATATGRLVSGSRAMNITSADSPIGVLMGNAESLATYGKRGLNTRMRF